VPEIAPFAGIRYDTARFGSDLSKLVAPPYDVLEADDKAALIAIDPHNIVTVDLPYVPPKSAGPAALYDQAASTLKSWRSEGILQQESEPALYVYHQEYSVAGQSYTRKMFFARMRLEEFGKGTVFPHEQTFGGPKEDRRMLMETTRCQLSAIFALYSDPERRVNAILDVGKQVADVTAQLDGVVNKMWVITDAEVIEAVRKAMADRAVYIADGHHRYGTALMYRDVVAKQAGPLPADHPANFILIGLCAMEDPGCLILPTHRAIADFGGASLSDILTALQKGIDITPLDQTPDDPEALLPPDADADLAIYVAADNKTYRGTFTQRKALPSLAPDRSEAWQELDLAYLHRYLIEECLTNGVLKGEAPTTTYHKGAAKAVDSARATNGIALLCKACTMEQLRAVSHAGDLMPQKSTFFYPKLATGLVIHSLE
jgi:uncharacterized protein (DUF1015 family)